jgi:hypothetical protein
LVTQQVPQQQWQQVRALLLVSLALVTLALLLLLPL